MSLNDVFAFAGVLMFILFAFSFLAVACFAAWMAIKESKKGVGYVMIDGVIATVFAVTSISILANL